MKRLVQISLLLMAPLAHSEVSDTRVYGAISGGVTVSDDSEYETGPAVQGLVGFPLSDRFALEVNVTQTSLDVTNLASTEDYDRLTAGLDLRADLAGSQKTRYFALVGVNGHKIDFLLEELSGFGGNVGLGFRRSLGEHLEFRGEARYYMDKINGEGIVPDDTFYTFGFLAGLQYRFGDSPAEAARKLADDDGDGVTNGADKCPNTPKGVAVSSDGCPLDDDHDGVPNHIDQCPNTPLGVEVDSTGCPLDSDKDGVNNSRDLCPNTPAGHQVDVNGCSIDKDQDGVLNTADQCPNTYPGLKVDGVGCVVKEQTLTVHNIHFEFDRAVLMPDSMTLLNRVAATFAEQPQLKATIAGHADSLGSADYNQRLSSRRAQAVLDYLVSQGIASDRLSAAGFGESRPIATNATEEGRATNRRVEFILR